MGRPGKVKILGQVKIQIRQDVLGRCDVSQSDAEECQSCQFEAMHEGAGAACFCGVCVCIVLCWIALFCWIAFAFIMIESIHWMGE